MISDYDYDYDYGAYTMKGVAFACPLWSILLVVGPTLT